jgi:endonuclease G
MFRMIIFVLSILSMLAVNATEPDNLLLGTPGNADTIVNREGYALGYSEKYEQPLWVIYRVTQEELDSPRVKRTDDFRPDPAIKTGSASLSDYRKSGYDRGHLAPAATMGFSKQTMSESFYLSNMSPQKPKFNRGIWKDLESQVRIWGKEHRDIYVVSGPIIKPGYKTIGKNAVAVPQYYYKVIFDISPPSFKMIAFILENKGSNQPLKTFVVTVDDVEKITGLDFFSELPDIIENKLESQSNIDQWNKKDIALEPKNAVVTKEKQNENSDLALPIKYVASKRSKVFHRSGCPYAQKIADYNKIEFEDKDAAVDTGRRPCKKCRP